MTREGAKELLPKMQAFADGETIQDWTNDTWKDKEYTSFGELSQSPIKPQPKYRPFKSQEECWNEMLKHQPFGWIRYDDSICTIQNIAPDGITVTDGIKMSNFYFEECFTNTKFADGTPFGIEK